MYIIVEINPISNSIIGDASTRTDLGGALERDCLHNFVDISRYGGSFVVARKVLIR